MLLYRRSRRPLRANAVLRACAGVGKRRALGLVSLQGKLEDKQIKNNKSKSLLSDSHPRVTETMPWQSAKLHADVISFFLFFFPGFVTAFWQIGSDCT